jgi:enamine deaminase RidA (YjgF/YER057c/UK114 family)
MGDQLRFVNPKGVHAPLGPYSHTVVVPPGAGLLCLSGQIGARSDLTVGATIGEQADQAFANIVTLLDAHGLDVSSIVKLTVFIVSGHDGDAVRKARLKHLGSHEPASTTVYVSQLVRPEWFVEVDAIAARV